MSLTLRWYGQSAFSLRTPNASAFVDPFDRIDSLRARGFEWNYPRIETLEVDVILVTHEHQDHNGIGAIAGATLVRSTAGTLSTTIGTVVAIASEHDDAAGIKRGPNTIFVNEMGGLRWCHMGDFGQSRLRPEQRDAIGAIDLLLIPVGGGGATIDGNDAAEIVGILRPKWVVPMHYRTPGFAGQLEGVDGFLAALPEAHVVKTTAEFTIQGPPFDGQELVVLLPHLPS